MKLSLTIAAFFVVSLFATLPARAVLIIDCVESGGNIQCLTSGSANLAGLTPDTTGFSTSPSLSSQIGNFGIGAFGAFDPYFGLSGPANFGTGPGVAVDVSSGPLVGLRGFDLQLRLPSGYVSGAPILNSSATFSATLAEAGLVPGSHVWFWGSGANADSMTLNISAVPEPSAFAIFSLVGLGAAGFRARRR